MRRGKEEKKYLGTHRHDLEHQIQYKHDQIQSEGGKMKISKKCNYIRRILRGSDLGNTLYHCSS